ncbi:hypothetical protein C4K09_3102 [Pseudomonas chlororaphis subsp. aureofaciens]|nr:hypothetical protein C4K09_3102 [Pseudomonas chlororaphis subsp. aureofaciens]
MEPWVKGDFPNPGKVSMSRPAAEAPRARTATAMNIHVLGCFAVAGPMQD